MTVMNRLLIADYQVLHQRDFQVSWMKSIAYFTSKRRAIVRTSETLTFFQVFFFQERDVKTGVGEWGESAFYCCYYYCDNLLVGSE